MLEKGDNMIYIRFVNEVKLSMIRHMLEDPYRECGGFLYGNVKKTANDILCDVNTLYYEHKYGSDCEFNFGLS